MTDWIPKQVRQVKLHVILFYQETKKVLMLASITDMKDTRLLQCLDDAVTLLT